MKPRGALALLLVLHLCACAAGAETEDGNNPLQKVIQLMTSLQGKIIADGEEEQKTYVGFTKWCGKSADEKQQEIKEGSALKEELEARIGKATSDAEEASTQISELTGSIATDEADLKAATLLREKERNDFQSLDQELTSTINTLTRAHKLLETQLKDAGVSKASFLQKPTRGLQLFRATLSEVVNAAIILSEEDRAKIQAMLQETDGSKSDGEGNGEDDGAGAPAGSAYESHSSGVLDAVQSMQDKAEEAQVDSRSKEQNQRLNFESFAQSLTAKITSEKKDLENTKSDMARANEINAASTKALEACNKDLAADKKFLEDMQRDCMNRATDFAEEQRERAAELEALATAKKAVQDSSAGAAASFVQVGEVQQHRSGRQAARAAEAKGAVMHRLRALAKRTGSMALAQLTSRISAAFRHRGTGRAEPFAKVKGLIENMIYKLEREQKSEATQKQFCDKEMGHTEQTKEERQDDIEEMTVHLESMTAEVARLQEDLKTLSMEMSDLFKSQAEMDRIRKEEHIAMLVAASDLKEGLAGVQRALQILRDYYGGGAGAASLLQEDVAADMTQESQLKQAQQEPGGSSAGGGIIGLLEVVEADFAKSLTETQTLEQTSQEQYDKLTQEIRVTGATQETEVKHKNAEKAKLRKNSAQVASDRGESQQELDAVNEYWEKLSKQCSQEKETYAGRAEKRQAEIEGLQEALTILENS
mmetsp:Transcript_149756/g.480906  ORF Transcript_149756/g.480906 Transcript_149756/m.480906 type:complete len:708 (+) Transcript_149756:58-2181(+)